MGPVSGDSSLNMENYKLKKKKTSRSCLSVM